MPKPKRMTERMKDKIMENKMTFEAALARLEEQVKRLESGALSLDEMLLGYEEAIRLSRICHARLEGAKERVAILERDASGGYVEHPFDGEGAV